MVVGGGLAGIAAALACADAGARVTLLEKRARLGGLTWSFSHGGLTMDNGQHVLLRCCTAYLDFLGRIGSAGDVELQDRLDVTVVAASDGGRALRPAESSDGVASDGAGSDGPRGAARTAVLRRDRVRPPLHLARSLLRYGHVPWAERARLGPAVLALSRLDLDDPALDEVTFATWLARHHQGPGAARGLWDLICLPTVNLPADEASLAMAAAVFQKGLLTDSAGGDIGWSRVPLGLLHGQRAAAALDKAGVEVLLRTTVAGVEPLVDDERLGERPSLRISGAGGEWQADAVIVALPHYAAEAVLPPAALGNKTPSLLGSSPIVNVHVWFDRRVTDLPLVASIGSLAQWVFDRTRASGADRGQYLAVSISAADEVVGWRPEQLERRVIADLRAIFPTARHAGVISSFVTKEHHATFRAAPGSAAHRSPPRTRVPGLVVAGAWTATGWPATMEGAVRSGVAAARTALVAAGQRRGLPAAITT
ncbi:MAG TPA: hydroxysqualene dehydroxylase HpnE [Acidimicrobiales bacterium]|nr:hydroxysqualene dehydroxylase HpnE [Acidimicrobiales bacterium]